MAVQQFYAGDELQITFKFANLSGAADDPTTVTVSVRDNLGRTTEITKAITDLTHVSTGNYTLNLDTTTFVDGPWIVQCVSTGAVTAVQVATFTINARPL